MADRTDLADGVAADGSGTGSEAGNGGDAASSDPAATLPPAPSRARRRRLRRAALATLGVIGVAGGGLWLARERIADSLIASQLAQTGLPATYEIETIGGRTQVLRNIVIGDPRKPDLTVERMEVRMVYGLGGVRIGGVTLIRPRLYGHHHADKLSFGALDKLLFGPSSGEPFRLPDYDLQVIDARGLIDSDYGRLAFKADGAGALRDGFAGSVAALVPEAHVAGCALGRASLYGRVTIEGERPRFSGPLRLTGARCGAQDGGQGAALGAATMQIDARADRDFAGVTVQAKLRGGALSLPSARADALTFDAAMAYRDGMLSGRLVGNAGGVHAPGATVALLGLDGLVRTRDGFRSLEFRGNVDGQGLRQGPALDAGLASAEASSAGTLIAPMVAQVRQALRREERGSRIAGQLHYRQEGDRWSFVVPEARLRGGSGASLLELSRFQVTGEPQGLPRIAGNFATGGVGLPRIEGVMERGAAGGALFRLTMAEYRAGGGALAIPQMSLAQVSDGSLGFSGTARLSGAIPGGSARNLELPVQGAFSARGELALYRHCITPRFDSLTLGEMVLDGRAVTVCPQTGGTIVRSGAGGLRVALGVPALALTGRLGETPLRIQSGPVGFAWPGTVTARALDVALGPPEEATRFRLADLTARAGKDFAGTFGGVEARLAAVPMDLTNAAGDWRYADGTLTLSGARFDLTDRLRPTRFERMVARDATLTLHDSRIDADAVLREPKSDRTVTHAVIRHDLADGSGHADLRVDGLRFDKAMQPDALTRMALGVIANVEGTVTGKGRIDWNARGVTSSGRFSSTGLDLAAAFGPARGLAGTVEFTDLLNMVTAPDQTLRVAAINPGIEVNDGVVVFAMEPDQVLKLHSATWPFLGGKLSLEPTVMRVGVAEARHYTLVIEGLDAAKFLERMELGNLAASGTFDGRMPLVFDDNGGRIEGGNLVSRAPGGNVSYVGALTYKDLSTMGNFAFEALKSIDYKTMTIGMRGDLAGEIVTNVQFGGVKQGLGTRRNFLTRQVAGLPIQFNVNIRAPFYRLITSAKSLYDPTYVQDPRTLGLVDAQGRVVQRLTNNTGAGSTGSSSTGPAISGSGIQRPESGNLP